MGPEHKRWDLDTELGYRKLVTSRKVYQSWKPLQDTGRSEKRWNSVIECRQMRHTDPSFYPLLFVPPSPKAHVIPGLVDVVHRARGGPQAASRELVIAADWRRASQSLHALAGCLLRLGRLTRATSISPGLLPPLSYIP